MQYLKNMKPPTLKEKLCIGVVADYAVNEFFNFGVKYLRKNEKVHVSVVNYYVDTCFFVNIFENPYLPIHMGPRCS